MIKDKIITACTKAKNNWEYLLAFIFINANTAYADWFDDKNIQVSGNVNAKTMMGRVLGIIGDCAQIVGIFIAVGGVIKFLQAKHDGNAAEESKAQWAIGIGAAFAAMPTIIKTLVA